MEPILALIIEDDHSLREIYRRVLESLDIKVDEAINGQEAVEKLEGYTPHLIILDMLLPYLSGKELLDVISSNPRLTETQIAVVSSMKQTVELMQQYPDVYFIQKPIRITQLRDLVEEIMQKISS